MRRGSRGREKGRGGGIGGRKEGDGIDGDVGDVLDVGDVWDV